jgi:dihydroorotate dehydrogenase (NAD+) catalytic subunit
MIKFPIDLSVNIGGLALRNPVMPASGTFAEGLDQVIDFNRLGAFVTKTITRELRAGNPLPRVVERPGGLINAIGIPSKGMPHFVEHVSNTQPMSRRLWSLFPRRPRKASQAWLPN